MRLLWGNGCCSIKGVEHFMNFVCLLSAFLAKSGGEVRQKCERTLPDA